MAQLAYSWLRESQPASTPLSDDPFSDIPIMESASPQAAHQPTSPPQSVPAINDDPFADIPIMPPTQTEQGTFSKYWEQVKAGAGELASAYQFDKARRSAEQLQELEQPGIGFKQGGGLLGGSIIPAQAKEGKQAYTSETMGEALTSAQQYRNYAGNIPQLDSVRKFMSGESGNGWWEDLKEDPFEIIAGLGARSAAGSTVALGAGMLGGLATGSPVGAMAGAGAASGRMEYMHSIMQGMDEQGIDWTNPDAFREAINNPEVMDPIKEQALKRGLIIGAFDGVAALMGGKIIAPKPMLAKSAAKAQLINLPAQTGIQGLLGGGGEATAQYATTGDINTREVIAEALGELVLAPVEFAGTYYSIAKGSKGVAADRLKATNELIDILLKKRQKAYNTGSADDIQQVSEELNQYMGLRDQLQEKVGQSDTETLLESERTMTQAMDKLHGKLLEADPQSEERDKISDQMVKLNARREQVREMLTSKPSSIMGEQPAMSREDALKEVEAERQQRRDKIRQEEEELYRQKQNPMAAASEAEWQAAQEGGDALTQQLAASGAYGNARSISEMADETVDREIQQEIEDEITELMEQIPNSTGARRIVLTKRFNDLTAGLLKRPTQQPVQAEPEEPYQAEPEEPYRTLPDILSEGQQRIQERQAQEQSAEQERARQETQQTIIALEKHLMEVQNRQDQESQQQADWDRAEIQRLQQELQAKTPTNPAIAQAMRQAEISVAEQQAESQRRVENWNQYNLAERQRYAHELTDEAVRTGQIGLLGEPIARAYAERGEIPPNLESTVSQAQSREIEQGYQSEMDKRSEQIRLGDEINRLEGHIQQQEQVDQAQQSWKSPQIQPGAIQQQEPVPLEGLLKGSPQQTKPQGYYPIEYDEIYGDWIERGSKEKGFQPTPRQKKLMDVVGKALDEGITYEDDLDKYVKKELAEELKGYDFTLAEDRVDGGAFGYDVYHARQAVETQRNHEENQKNLQQFSEGQDLENFEVYDGNKRHTFTKALVEKVDSEEGQITLYATKQGAKNRLRFRISASGLVNALERGKLEQARKEQAHKEKEQVEKGVSRETEPDMNQEDKQKLSAEIDKLDSETKENPTPEQQSFSPGRSDSETRNQVRQNIEKNLKDKFLDQYRGFNNKIPFPFVQSLVSLDYEKALDDVSRGRLTEEMAVDVANKAVEAGALARDQADRFIGRLSPESQTKQPIQISTLTGDKETIIEEVKAGLAKGLRYASTNDTYWIEDRSNRKGGGWVMMKKTLDGGFPGSLGGAGFNAWSQGEAINRVLENLDDAIEQVSDNQQSPEQESQLTEDFEQRLREIGKEWIKDQQHRFYFNDIIKELSGMDVTIPDNAKLWYDRNTEFYGHENLDDEVFDAVVERLEALRVSLLEEAEPTQVAPAQYGEDLTQILHTTKKGKLLKGYLDTTLTQEQAKAIDPFAFQKNNSWFLRDFRVDEYNEKLQAGTIEPVHEGQKKTESITDESTERTGERTLGGVPANQVRNVREGGEAGEGGRDNTGESGEHDHQTDGRGVRSELGGSEERSLPDTDIHSAGAVSDRETGSGGRGVLQGDIRVEEPPESTANTDSTISSNGEGREGGVNTGAADHTITEQDDIEGSSFKQVEKFNHNIEAIKLLKELGDRPATQKQQRALARYVGWGGLKQAFFKDDGTVAKGWEKRAAELKELLTPEEYNAAKASVLNAHYTTPSVVHAIYAGLEKLGFTHGRVLEPSVGVGNFFGMMPKEMRAKSNLIGVELDTITGGIAKKLYGGSARITAPMGFQDFDIAPGSFDLAIGNPPFGDETITDLKNRDISGLRIHNYFFAKSMKALRPGGVMAMVVSKGFMDSTKNQKGREQMFREAQLLGAYRLPNEAFKANANADVTTDIIFLQKRPEPLTTEQLAQENTNDYRNRAEFTGVDGNTMKINRYFVENPDNLLGDMIMNKGRFGPSLEPAMTTRERFDWKGELTSRVENLEGHYQPEHNVIPSAVVGRVETSKNIERADINGIYIASDGQLYRRLPDLEGSPRGELLTGYENNQGKTITFRQGDLKKLKDVVQLARTARELINRQVQEFTDEQLQPLRDQLNREYNTFVQKYKMLNRPHNKNLLNNADITIAPMLLALENNYKKEKKIAGKVIRKEGSEKADLFTQRTQEPWREVTTVSSPEEALIVSLAQTGRVDMDVMETLYGQSRLEIATRLTGQIYDDPQSGWVTKDDYLSGNVKLKLRQAKEAGRGYEDNVKALEEVQPVDVPPQDIMVSMGASWQTPDVINGFYEHLGGTEPVSAFIPERNFWSFKANGSVDADKAHKWTTGDIGLKELFTRLLNNKPIAIYKSDAASQTRRLDVTATDAAQAKANEIQDEFSRWLWQNTQRREAMTRRYNDLMNTNRTRQYDGSFLSLPGKISDSIIKLRTTQVNAVWRILQSPTTLLDHVVGAGKTFTMIAGAMELKRTGLAKKPMIIVPNHLVPQWAEDFARLYPNARVLAARKEDFNTHKRREMLARIATGNWDAVIIAHSSFGKMPNDTQMEQEFIQEQLNDLNEAIQALRETEGKGARSVRDAQNQHTKLKEKLKGLLDNTGKDVGMTWSETGVDALFVDEAHEFKNLQFYTSMDRVKNINPKGAKKAQDLFIKIRGLLQKTKGRNLVFATGTPISNSMGEMFTMQRYLAYDQLKQSGLNHFDAWARTFGTVDTRQERKSSGKFGPVSRFSKFVNLPELMTMYRQFADNINNEDIKAALEKEGKGVHIPKIKGGKPTPVIAPRSVYQEAYMGMIEHRFANMPEDPREDNPLKATNDARKAGLDMRMVFPDLPDVKESKINQSVHNMMGLYHKWQKDKGTQLVFCDLSTPKSAQAKEIAAFRKQVEEAAKEDDSGRKNRVKNMGVRELYSYLEELAEEGNEKAIRRLETFSPDDIEGWSSSFDVYNDIKQKLMTEGVPEEEIAFIHSANTDLQKEELFAKVNAGEVRFLLGSTAKMGAGTNVQERMVALHHLDAPWRPSDLEQREGRIIRQGNELFKRDPEGFEVEILRYATEQTYDVNMWQTLEVKARFIEQIRNGDTSTRSADDVAGESASAAEMKAASSGDPRIMEQVEIIARLKFLDNLRTTHNRDRTYAVMEVQREQQRKATLPQVISGYQSDLNNVEPQVKGKPQLTKPDGSGFKKIKDAEEWLRLAVQKQALDPTSPLWEGESLGYYRKGLEVYGELYEYDTFEGTVPGIHISLAGEREYPILSMPLEEVAWGGLFTRFNNAITKIERDKATEQNYLNNIDATIAKVDKRANEPFKHETEYQEKTARNQQLMEELGADQNPNPAADKQPEYVVLSKLTEEHSNKGAEAKTTDELLKNIALANRAGKLADSIRYSKPGKEKAAANKALKEAKQQGLKIGLGDLKAAREAIEAQENQSQPETPSQTSAPEAEVNPSEIPTEFTSGKDVVDYMIETQGTIIADNGNIRIDRMGRGWQITIKENPVTKSFDENSIVFDYKLPLLSQSKFTRIGNEMVLPFTINKAHQLIPYLFRKLDLQPESQVLAKPTVYSKVRNSASKGASFDVDTVKQIAEQTMQKLGISDSVIELMVVPSTEVVYGPEQEPFLATITNREGSEKPVLLIIAAGHSSSTDIVKTVVHELIGHLGLALFLTPKEKQQLLNKVKLSREQLKPAWDHVEENYSDSPVDEQAEEVITYIAENPPQWDNSRWREIVNFIKEKLQKIGLFKNHVTRKDIENVLSSIAQFYHNREEGNRYYSLGYGEYQQHFGSGIATEEQHKQPLKTISSPIYFRKSDNSASFNAKPGKDQGPRFFNTQGLAESRVIKAATRTRDSLMVPVRKGMLASMGLRQIVDTYARIFEPLAGQTWSVNAISKGNPIINYQKFVQGMQSLKSNKLKDADDVDIIWGKLAKKNKADYENVMDIMHRSTLYEVFPDRADFMPHEDERQLILEISETADPKQQAALRKRMMFERERKAEHKKLHAAYNALGKDAQTVYQQVEKFYGDMWRDQQKALEDKITRSIDDGDSRRAFLNQIKAAFHEARVRGPYFPLQRFGQFFVIAEDENGERYRSQQETEAKMHKERDTLSQEGLTVLSYGLMPDFTSRKLEGVSEFADQLHMSLSSEKFEGVPTGIREEIQNEVNQLALQLMPDVSAAKHMIRRKGVKGYSDNARRAFAYNAIHSANRLARTVYGDQMTAEMERVREDIDAQTENPWIKMQDRTVAAQVLSVLERQHETIMNPKGSPIAARITNLAFIWYLGASAGAGLVNLTQTPLVGIPLMGGRFGYRKTSQAILKAAKDYAVHGYNKVSLRESVFTLSKAKKGVTENERKMLVQLIDDGTVDTTQTSSLAQISDTDLKAEAQTQQDAWVKVNRLLGFAFHNAETANREVTALATYRMAIAEGQTHKNAVNEARKMVFDSHFDYSGANRPLVMKNDWMKVFTIFKQYSQNMTYTLVRNFVDSRPFSNLTKAEKKRARKALFGILASHALAAGTMGLPLINWIGPLLAAALGDDDDEFKDWETLYRNWLSDMFGQETGHALAKGVINGFTGVDLHSRVSINELWLRSPNWDMTAREENLYYLTQLLGPAVGAVLNGYVGIEQVANGDWKGLEKMFPKFVADGLRTYRYSTEGATVGRGGYQAVVEEFTSMELGLQALGLAPARLGEAYQARTAVKNIQERILTKRQELTASYANAIRQGDYQSANEALTEITRFNEQNPSFRITPQGLKNSLRMRYRYENMSEAGIYLPQAQLGLLREARFAL